MGNVHFVVDSSATPTLSICSIFFFSSWLCRDTAQYDVLCIIAASDGFKSSLRNALQLKSFQGVHPTSSRTWSSSRLIASFIARTSYWTGPPRSKALDFSRRHRLQQHSVVPSFPSLNLGLYTIAMRWLALLKDLPLLLEERGTTPLPSFLVVSSLLLTSLLSQ